MSDFQRLARPIKGLKCLILSTLDTPKGLVSPSPSTGVEPLDLAINSINQSERLIPDRP